MIRFMNSIMDLASKKKKEIGDLCRRHRTGILALFGSSLTGSPPGNLALACGMRNILVHEYEAIDYKIIKPEQWKTR